MLQPENRLTKARDFNLLLGNGRILRGKLLLMRYVELKRIPEEKLPKRIVREKFVKQLKIGFSVALKIDKRAVVRNRLKRQLREVVRLLIKNQRLEGGYYVLLVAKKEVIGADYESMQKEVEELLYAARILH